MEKEIRKILYENLGYVDADKATKELLDLFSVSGSAFTKNDLKNAFEAGADKRNWTKVKLTGVVSGNNFTLEPIFDKWHEHYH